MAKSSDQIEQLDTSLKDSIKSKLICRKAQARTAPFSLSGTLFINQSV